ncbi:MAG: cytochrome c biogenesis protein CcsA [Cyanobacteria bacterium P01_F01_bin.150]
MKTQSSDGLSAVRTLAVQLDGRQKPLDTVAVETVSKVYGATTYRYKDAETHAILQEDALHTYLNLWLDIRHWTEEPIILVNYRRLKDAAGLTTEREHFTFQELSANGKLADMIQHAHQPERDDKLLSRKEQDALIVENRINILGATMDHQTLPIVPHPTEINGQWFGLNGDQTLYSQEEIELLRDRFAMIQHTLLSNHDIHFSTIDSMFSELKRSLRDLSPAVYPSDRTLKREVFFNRFHPFTKAWELYALAFGATLIGLWIKPWNLYWTGIGLCTVGVGVQAYGFILRMAIGTRPPVTNMYESVVWVGFGIAAIALLFELINRSRYYLLVASPLAIMCLVLADSLPTVLDPSISPLAPSLQDNLWLSIHVPAVVLSYACFALALGLGHVALGNYLFTPNATHRVKTLSQLNYRVLQVGISLLTIGAILGGFWANFSWGRFWGWDPKETWALIALLCYLVPLYSRLVRWIGDFGLNVASVIAFNAVLMAWYGVNFIIGGLHSYGFGTGGPGLLLIGIVGLDLVFVFITAARHYGWSMADILTTSKNG